MLDFRWSQKLGLGDCSLENLVSNLTRLGRGMNFNIDGNKQFALHPLHAFSAVMFYALYVWVFYVSLWYDVLVVVPQSHDIVKAIELATISGHNFILTTKLSVLRYHRTTLQEILGLFRALDARVDSASPERVVLQRRMRTVKVRCVVYVTFFNIGSVSYLISVFIEGLNGHRDKELVILGLKSSTATTSFLVNFLVTCIVILVGSWLAGMINLIYIILVGYTESYLHSLADILLRIPRGVADIEEDLKDVEDGVTIDRAVNRFVADELHEVVERHGELLQGFKKLKNVFKLIVTTDVLIATVAFCAVLLGDPGAIRSWGHVQFTLGLMLLNCYVGQQLINAAKFLEYAAYASGWERFDARNRKKLHFVLSNCQNGMKIASAMGAVMSYETFLNLIHTVYSAYATMRGFIK